MMKQHINPEGAKYYQSPLLNQLMTPDLCRNGGACTNRHTHIILLVLPLLAGSGLSFNTVLNICCLKNPLNNCVLCTEAYQHLKTLTTQLATVLNNGLM